MKSIACISSSVRTACQHTAACFPLNRGFIHWSSRCSNVDFNSRTAVAQHQFATDVPTCHGTHVNTVVVQQVSAAPPPTAVPIPVNNNELTSYQSGRLMPPKTPSQLSPYSPYTKAQSNALVMKQSLFEGEAISDLCSSLADLTSNDRAEGLATLLGACVESGMPARSPLVHRLINECLELLSKREIAVAQLCHLGEVAHALEGRQSALMTQVLDSLAVAVEEDVALPSEAVRVYSLLALCYDPTSQQQGTVLSTLNRQTHRLVHQLKSNQVSKILQSLQKLNLIQPSHLVQRLRHRALKVFSKFSDDEVRKVLSVFMALQQHDEKLLAAMEKDLPGRLGEGDPKLINTVMLYCLHTRWRSEPIFEAVAENFVCHAEKHTTVQIVNQIVTMGRLNYLPQCSSEMFKKLESILSTRFFQFQPHSLIRMLHACILLERFPLNYMPDVLSPYFLQRLHAEEQSFDKRVLGQLTHLHFSVSLECTHYLVPRLPCSLSMSFPPMKQTSLLYEQVKGPLRQLLGGCFYSRRFLARSGYVIDVEICLDENGYVLSWSQRDDIYRRIALCLDDPSRFCNNTHHLMGIEATKRRHLRRLGYEVVQIPYFEFVKLGTQEEKVQYLRNKIFPFPPSTTNLPIK